jgi:TfoX/Sxy family transcriptional regulator of competence genes
MAYSEALATRVRAILQGSAAEERKMFGGLAFLVGGRMCCGVQDTDLMVRVPKEQHAQMLTEPHVRPMDFTGRSLQGFVYVAEAGTGSAAALRRWVSLAERVAVQAAGAKPRRRKVRPRGRVSRPDRAGRA